MKRLHAVVALMLLFSTSAFPLSRINKVWGYGWVIYGQGTMTSGSEGMPQHRFTVKTRMTSPLGRTTGWVTKITQNNMTNANAVQMSLVPGDEGNYLLEVSYDLYCPRGVFSSIVILRTAFTVGHSSNCLKLKVGTCRIVEISELPKKEAYSGQYERVPSCSPNCKIDPYRDAVTPLRSGTCDTYLHVFYYWLDVRGYRTCLAVQERDRVACSSGDCVDEITIRN